MPSKIEYCDETLEVTGGCTKCSSGCKNCWALREVWRMAHNPLQGDKWKGLVEKKDGVLNWTGKIKCFEDALEKLRKKPTTYFIDSKADLFHPKVPFEFIDEFMQTITMYPQHTFMIFTKRVERPAEYFQQLYAGLTKFHRGKKFQWPFRNIQLILSISTQAEADEKIPIFLQIPATVRGLSIEPLLGEIKFSDDKLFCDRDPEEDSPMACVPCRCEKHWQNGTVFGPRIGCLDWIVVGGESGPGARPMHPDWPRSIRDQCVAAGVPFYFKQWGAWEIANKENAARNGYIVADGRGGILTPYNKKKFVNINRDGSYYRDNPQPNSIAMARVGKKRAGCLLDGREWKQLPKGVL